MAKFILDLKNPRATFIRRVWLFWIIGNFLFITIFFFTTSILPDFNQNHNLICYTPEKNNIQAPYSAAENSFNLTTIINSTGLNSPSDIAIDAAGNIYIENVRKHNIVKLESNGSLTELCEITASYALDYDPNLDALYSYSFVTGNLTRIYMNGTKEYVAEIEQGFGESPIAVDPTSGDIYIAHCSSDFTSKLYRVTATGQKLLVFNPEDYICALAFKSDGSLYFTYGNGEVFQFNKNTLNAQKITTSPSSNLSFHSLVFDNSGNMYHGTGDWENSGEVYVFWTNNTWEKIIDIPDNGVEGMIIDSDNNLIAVQRCAGGIINITLSNSKPNINYIIKGNNLNSPQALTVSPYGDIFIVNDDGGRITRVVNGNNEPFARANTYTPPHAFITADYFGRILMTESAPGFQDQLVWFNNPYQTQDRTKHIFTKSIAGITGITFDPSGNIVVSDYNGPVYRVSNNGDYTKIAGSYPYPTDITYNLNGDLIVLYYEYYQNGFFDRPDFGDVISRFDGYNYHAITYDNLTHITDIIMDNQGRLYATANSPIYGRGVFEIDQYGVPQPVINGTIEPDGITIDIEGNLIVTDCNAAALYKIITPYPRGTIIGRVLNPDTKVPMANVSVQIWHNKINFMGILTKTNATGYFEVNVTPGSYDLRIIDGYVGDYFYSEIDVEPDETISITIDRTNNDYPNMPAYPDLNKDNWLSLSPKTIIGLIIQVAIYGTIAAISIKYIKKKRRKKLNNSEIDVSLHNSVKNN
ncbi:MAG: hypothetical protein ACTSRZ_13790 [Promethearchaeota archaeon]